MTQTQTKSARPKPKQAKHTPPAATPIEDASSAAPRASKRETVLALLAKQGGTNIAELMAATGWQPHSVRAFVSTLRKAGSPIVTEGRAATMRYGLEDKR